MASRVDRATGRVSWTQFEYQLIGDPDVVPAPPAQLLEATGMDGQTLKLDPKQRRLEVHCGKERRLMVESFPDPGSSWRVATFTGRDNDHLFLAHPGGVRLFRYTPTASERRTRWDRSAVAGDHASLLGAILANPDDDALRLVYADFLEENGEAARAELIRLQCEIAEQMRAGPVSERGRKMKRARDLQYDHRTAWLADFPTPRGVQWVDFWRGFPVPQVVSTQTLIRLFKDLSHLTPLEAAVIQLRSGGLDRLSRSEVMPRLRVLDLNGSYIGPHQWSDDLEAFTRSPGVSGLRGLRSNGVNDDGAGALAASPHLSGLEWLRLAGSYLTDRGATALAESTSLPALRWIDLTGQPLSEDSVARLRQRFRRVVF